MSWFTGVRRGGAAAVAVAMLSVAAAAPAQIAPDPQSPPGAPARTLRDLVDRYLDFRGGDTFAALQSLHERLYLETALSKRTGSLWLDRDGRLRRETDGDDGRTVEAATPDGAWRQAAGGPVADDPGGRERARRWALIEFGDAFTGRGGASVALAGTADMEDHTWSVVRLSFGDADRYDALIDPVTGALCCLKVTEGGAQRTLMYGGWRLVDGVRLPFTVVTEAGGETASRVTSVELNRPFDPSLFQRPTAEAAR